MHIVKIRKFGKLSCENVSLIIALGQYRWDKDFVFEFIDNFSFIVMFVAIFAEWKILFSPRTHLSEEMKNFLLQRKYSKYQLSFKGGRTDGRRKRK